MSTDSNAAPAKDARPVPHENCYWVPGCHLLAGEYPGHQTDAGAREKLNALLDAGVHRFIDLTEEGEYDLRP